MKPRDGTTGPTERTAMRWCRPHQAGWNERPGHVAATDDDNKTDFAVCAPKYDTSRSDAGRVDVYSGKDGDRLFSRKGQAAGDRYGSTLAAAGDVDGDGRDDVLIGASRHDTGGSNAGRAYVLSGTNGSAIMVRDGARAGDRFGQSLTDLGDVDGDGTPDPFVGASKSDIVGNNAGRGHIGRSAAGLLPAGWVEPAPTDFSNDEDEGEIESRTFVEDADLDDNGSVDLDDLLALLSAWGGDDQRADIDGDGDVNVDDLVAWLEALE